MTTKPFNIPKELVWQAYKLVRANAGAAGVDNQSIDEFNQDLKGNLYKLWNRMSSGSYFPPPVKEVAIPKKARRCEEAGNTNSDGPNCANDGEINDGAVA